MEDTKVNQQKNVETKEAKSKIDQWEDWKKLAAQNLFKQED